LFNRATLTQPGQPGRDADACGDVPNIVHDKEFVSATAANGGWNVVYRIVATNNGGASGVYTLSDQPAMDNDVTINSASFVSSVPSNVRLERDWPVESGDEPEPERRCESRLHLDGERGLEPGGRGRQRCL
jgi:hypothetical protein